MAKEPYRPPNLHDWRRLMWYNCPGEEGGDSVGQLACSLRERAGGDMGKASRGRGRLSLQELSEALGALDEAVLSEVDGVGPQRVVEMAEAALAEFDYERAAALFRVAVVKSEGDGETVCRLATFLVDDYAQFEDAVRLLTSSACEVNAAGKRLLARSLFMLERKAEALAVYRELNEAGGGDALSWKRQGILLKDQGDSGGAIEALLKALALDAADGEAERLKGECEQALADRLSADLAGAERKLESGEVEEAGKLLSELDSGGWLPPEFYRLRKRVEERQRGAEKDGLAGQAREREAAGDLDGAAALVRQALEIDSEDRELRGWAERLETSMRVRAAADLRQRGDAAVAGGDLAEAISLYCAAWMKDETAIRVPGEEGDAGGVAAQPTGHAADAVRLLRLVGDYMENASRIPTASQAQALEALHRAVLAERADDLEQAVLLAGRAGALMDLHPAGAELKLRIVERRRWLEEATAREAFQRAQLLEREGKLDAAAEAYEQAAPVAGFALAEDAGQRAAALRRTLSAAQAEESLISRVTALLEKREFFQALRELAAMPAEPPAAPDGWAEGRSEAPGMPCLGTGDGAVRQRRGGTGPSPVDLLETRAREGIAEKYPVVAVPLPPPLLETRTEYRSRKDGVLGFKAGATITVNTSPDSGEVFLVSGRNLLCLDVRELRAVGTAQLPPAAEIAGKNAFVLYDMLPGDRSALLFLNFEDDYLMQVEHRRGRIGVTNVMPLARCLRGTRQQVRRWFVPAGREEKLMICQSAPGAGGGTAFYGISLHDGRLLHEEEFGHTLTNLRRLPGREGMYLVHRHPEPSQMRRPGYFSFALVDSRMRISERFHVQPQDIDGTFVESCRWFRFGKQGWYALVRYFDMYSGQLIQRPLAFLAMGADKQLRYAVSDSSQLLQKTADLEPLGELIEGPDGQDLWVVSGRKGNEQTLFVIDLATFKTVRKTTVPEGETVVAIAAGARPGEYVTVSLVGEDGEVVVRKGSGQ